MQKILFPTDFSPVASHALRFALHLADALGAELILLHVYHYAMLDTDLVPSGVLDALERQTEAEAQSHFEGYSQAIQTELGVDIRTTYVLQEGYPLEQILNYAQLNAPDWIVMGTTGARNPIENFFGSTTAGIMKTAQAPVLAIPPQARIGPIKRIAFATDLSEEAMGLTYGLGRLAKKLTGELVRVHVRPKADAKTLAELEQIHQGDLLHENIPFYAVSGPTIAEAIKQFVHEHHIDLIIVLQHQYAFWEQLFHRSLTRDMVLHSETPILAFSERVA